MDADKFIKFLTGGFVLAVAIFAAVISYQHIYDLSRTYGQSSLASMLMPLSVDGLIASASLAMLYAARHKVDVSWLPRSMLVLGIAATVAANAGYGIRYGIPGVVISAWPAVAFIGSVETLLWLVRVTVRPAVKTASAARAATLAASWRPRRKPARPGREPASEEPGQPSQGDKREQLVRPARLERVT